jgi:hypothetical protein
VRVASQLPQICIAPFVAEGRLVPLLADSTPPTTRCCLFYARRRHVPVKLQVLVDFFRCEAASRPSRREQPPMRAAAEVAAARERHRVPAAAAHDAM